MKYSELKNLFREHESTEPKTHLTAHIVFTTGSFTKEYPVEARTYVVSSYNKAFRPNMGGYSIFGNSLDGQDMYVRLEGHMRAERGGEDGWVVEDCYLVDESKKIIKNLSQLKKQLMVGTEFEILEHCRKENVGQVRRISKADTQGFYSIIPAEPDSKVSQANGGKGSWNPWSTAPYWEFRESDASCAVYIGKPDNKDLVMRFRII